MEAKIGVFETQEEALKAVKLLVEQGIDAKAMSLIGKAEIINDDLHVKSTKAMKNAPAYIGVGGGLVVGILTGIGVFAIPGFGFLYGAGAAIGAIAGFDVGLVGGGIATLLASLGINKDHVVVYHEHLNEGKFLLMLHGDASVIAKAESILG